MSAPEVGPVTKAITQPQINAYADASGDHNPIHVDESFAASTPFGGTIAHGMLVLASVYEMMTAALGEKWLRAGRLKIRFRAPARPGDTVTVSAAAQAPRSDGAPRYAVECRNQDGEVLISGTAELASRGHISG